MISLQVGGFAAKAEWENKSVGKTGNFRIIQILGIYSHILVVEQNGKISWTCVKQSLFQPLNQKHVDFKTSEPVVEKHWLISGFMSSSCGIKYKIVNKILQLLCAMNYHSWCKTVLWYLSLLTDTKETFCFCCSERPNFFFQFQPQTNGSDIYIQEGIKRCWSFFMRPRQSLMKWNAQCINMTSSIVFLASITSQT